MRAFAFIAAAAAFAVVSPACAVTIAPVSFSAEFQNDLEEDFGLREGEYLREFVQTQLTRALAREGVNLTAADLVIETTIVEADPNKPTMQQMSQTPGLDYGGSVSIGGAELVAVLRRNGEVVGEVSHRWYSPSIAESNFAGGSWADARRAIRFFANEVAEESAGMATQAAN